jgi:2-oxoglutarate dehydrogenase E2 component (dihydrolipoamide succinyltransferase)
VVKVGQTIAIIETEGGSVAAAPVAETVAAPVAEVANTVEVAVATAAPADFKSSDKFFSPLVKNIATAEGISITELENIAGSGKDGRVTKEDILSYIKNRGSQPAVVQQPVAQPTTDNRQPITQAVPVSVNGGDEIVEMDRMRKLISGYMVASVQTSAHVQSFIEVDVTNIVKWRDRVKNAFEKREGEKLTFTPIFMEAVAKALKDFPGMNISVDGDFIIKRKNINLGMAAALPNGNLIVPVIKNADQLNLVGMAKAVNDLGNRAKAGKLKPDDTQGGTYTVTNVGTFGSVFGTPIINQPQVGILALGAIRKVPAVIETPEGDFIGIRQKMFLSHSYDHRVVDGALGGSFVKRVAEYLEAFDVNREY